MGMLASAVIAARTRKNNQNYAFSSQFNKEKVSSNTNWLKEHSPQILLHVNETLLKNIYSEINCILAKNISEPELKNAYLTLIHSLSMYQTKAENIFFKKNYLKSHALFFTIMFALSLLIFFCISIIYPVMFPLMGLSFLFCVGFIGVSLYSSYKLQKKHPTNESELNMHFETFIHTFEKFANKRPNNFQADLVQLNEPKHSHINTPEISINAANLKNKTSFFKFSDSAEECPTVMEQEKIGYKLS
ncbi:MAG: hypothetical protein REH83_00200 [Rickettsiella sp.]|nr:hypothetical protein [Rickettsiella sp.]